MANQFDLSGIKSDFIEDIGKIQNSHGDSSFPGLPKTTYLIFFISVYLLLKKK